MSFHPPDPEPKSRRPWRMAVAVILIVVAVGLVLWAFKNRAVADKVMAAAVAAGQAIVPSAARLPAESAAGAESSGPSDAARPASRSRADTAARPRATPPALPVSRVDPPPDPVVSSVARSAPDQSPSSSSIIRVIEPTYNATNVDVVPPRLLTPLAHVPLRAESRQEVSAAAIEVIVNEDGTVDSVKSTIRPTTLTEAIQVINGLSIAKTWRFGPALRGGQPVKYRLLVPLGTF